MHINFKGLSVRFTQITGENELLNKGKLSLEFFTRLNKVKMDIYLH